MAHVCVISQRQIHGKVRSDYHVDTITRSNVVGGLVHKVLAPLSETIDAVTMPSGWDSVCQKKALQGKSEGKGRPKIQFRCGPEDVIPFR